MSQDVYRRLAQTLDAIPNGFPATESGAELRLLAAIFTPDEASLASVMTLSWETAADIGARAGLDPKTAYQMLKTMARKGQIYASRKDRELAFRLMPFAVGIYEEQLPRMDAHLARLFEDYHLEVKGAFARHSPPLHRVIPVEEAVPADIEIFPFERATQLLENARSWGVRDCICRVQQRLVGKGCDRPVENCLVFAPVEGLFEGGGVTRAISKQDALRILAEAEDAGLVHSPGNYQDGNFYI